MNYHEQIFNILVSCNNETFKYVFDNSDWKKCDPVFGWELYKGQNILLIF